MKMNTILMSFWILPFLVSISCSTTDPPEKANEWFKGNLHAHSYWSDGDDFPEMIMDWYKNHDYQFAVLSDHNILQTGEKWINIDKVRRGPVALEKYMDRFGSDWIDEKYDEQGNHLIRLKTIDEYRPQLEQNGRFIIIQSEEITDEFEDKPIHVNATNIQELIEDQGGNSVSDVLQNNIYAVNEQREETGIPMIPHINHPNFGWAITPEDMIELKGERFFEVYNGHHLVRNFGDHTHPGMDDLWDLVNTAYVLDGKPLLFGLATDDSHNYHDIRIGRSNSGRGWIRVNATELNTESIIEAMEAGKFYASSGVEFEHIQRTPGQLHVKVVQEEGVHYTIQFRGTKKSHVNNPGMIFHEVKGNEADYTMSPNDLFVRALVISDKLKENPYEEGEVERAWVQPILNKN